MSSNIKTIKFTAKLSGLFALLTYVITLNIELAFFSPHWPWMSNNFALAVCSGVFASMLVVMLCEIQKYLDNKDCCEQNMFFQAMYLYQVLFQLQKNVEEYLGEQNCEVPDNLLDGPTQMAQCQINAIRGLHYTPLSKKNRLMIAHRTFCTERSAEFDSVCTWKNYLRRSILETRIDNLKQSGTEGPVTSTDALVKQILTTINGKCLSLLDYLSDYLTVIDQTCNNRFEWCKIKSIIHENYISLFETGKFEDFLTQENATISK